jgi:hypothetical protein
MLCTDEATQIHLKIRCAHGQIVPKAEINHNLRVLGANVVTITYLLTTIKNLLKLIESTMVILWAIL